MCAGNKESKFIERIKVVWNQVNRKDWQSYEYYEIELYFLETIEMIDNLSQVQFLELMIMNRNKDLVNSITDRLQYKIIHTTNNIIKNLYDLVNLKYNEVYEP